MVHHVLDFINAYGYQALFLSLFLGMIGLPVPDETIMTYVGYLVYKGNMLFIPAMIVAFLGTSIGISISYLIGKWLGKPMIIRYGRKFGLTEEKFKKAENLYGKIGPIFLTLGYFIPGVRHVAAIIAGVSTMRYRLFALCAYSGALLWSTLFIFLGKIMGSKWKHVSEIMKEHTKEVIILVVIIIGIILLLNVKGRKKKQ